VLTICLFSCEISFKKAMLAARRTLVAAQVEEKRLILLSYAAAAEASTTEPAPVHNRRSHKTADQKSEDKEVNASSDVTAALRRTHEMMTQELSKSQFAHDTLKESTAALERLGENYSTLDTMLSSSRNILGTLLRSQKSDTWYLETSFYLLCATIAWLLWRRLLYGPTWWLVWFPMKIFLRSLMGVLTGVGLIGGSTSSSVSAVPSSVPTESLVTHRSAAGKLSMPSGAQGPPSVRVGGGGRGAPMSGPNTPPEPSRPSPDTHSEKVGKIIDDSNEEYVKSDVGDVLDTEDSPRNPKKRMWEEEKEAEKHAQRTRDEL
jgi:protein transport protein SEC20